MNLNNINNLNNTESIWVKNDIDIWILAEIKQILEDTYLIETPNKPGETTVAKRDTLQVCDVNITQLTEMIHLNEANILEALATRYKKGIIYTHTGEVLIAINPFKTLDIYTLTSFTTKVSIPHVYQSAELCLERLNSRSTSQSILVSGESGAGKTQTTKYIMKYLSYKSKLNNKENELGIENLLLESNPILESFGNSKTRRNENSSRFGKYIKIYFDNQIIVGANIETYLLEKTRLTNHHEDELNFHIIYSIIQDNETNLVNKLDIVNYANEKNIKPYISYLTTVNALKAMNFSEDIISAIYNLIIGLLSLGNYTSSLENKDATLAKCASKIGIASHLLEDVLTMRQRKIGEEIINTPLSETEIISTRDTLAKALYGALFNYLVEAINKSIKCDIVDNQDSHLSIGLLDIFGFEVFEENGFEQLAINYTNERLQCLFNNEMIQAQQVEYQNEGLTWEPINFTGNELCLSELDNNVFPLLDEATRLASSGDKEFVNRLRQQDIYKHITFPKQDPPPYFTVCHFAGEVDYTVENFTVRNTDAIHPQLIDLLTKSTDPFIFDLTDKIPKGVISSLAFKSISSQFRTSLHNLIRQLKTSNLHYIRCLKPNDRDLPNTFNRSRIVEQLRYNGVLEAVKVSREGFPIRMKHLEYHQRYQALPDYDQAKDGIIKGYTKYFIKNNAYLTLEECLANTKYKCCVTIQSAIRGYVSYHVYKTKLSKCLVIQNNYRRYLGKLKLLEHKLARLIQTDYRRYRQVIGYRSKYKAIITLQTLIRGYFAKLTRYRYRLNRYLNKLRLVKYQKRLHRSSIYISRFLKTYLKKQSSRIVKAQRELQIKTEELESVVNELEVVREREQDQQRLIKKLSVQQQHLKDYQLQLENIKHQKQTIYQKCQKQEEKNRLVIRENVELQEDIKNMQETVRRNNSTKLEILGEMENLNQENKRIKDKLEQYDKYIKNIEEIQNLDQRCLIQ